MSTELAPAVVLLPAGAGHPEDDDLGVERKAPGAPPGAFLVIGDGLERREPSVRPLAQIEESPRGR